jgi:uncharacterized protein YwqG
MVWMIVVVIAVAIGFVLMVARSPKASEAMTGNPTIDKMLEGRRATAEDLAAFLAPVQAKLEASKRPVLPITGVDFPEDAPTASKIGGRAWWPVGVAAPTAADGTPLVLLAQINFAEVPATPGYPRSGLVQFFIAGNEYYGANFDGKLGVRDLAEQRDFRVVYWPDLEQPATSLPVRTSDLLPHTPDKPRRMLFGMGMEDLTERDVRFDALFAGGHYRALEAFAEAHGVSEDSLGQAVTDRYSGGGSKLGGYPFFTQQDPRRDGEFELLLQLDSDDEEGMMWGDSGVAGFFIRPADLARGDFSEVVYNWDCY